MVICRGDGFMHYLGYKKEGGTKLFLQIDISDIDEQNKYGESLIYVATYFAEVELVLQLISLGANPNIQNMDGNSSLHAAAYTGNLKLLNALVDSGGDLRLVNSDGQRPCQLFKDLKCHQKIKAFEQSAFNQFLKYVKLRADPILIPQRKSSIFDNLPRISRGSSYSHIQSFYGYQSGFGNYDCQNKVLKGIISSIKIIINSKCLKMDSKADLKEFSCGVFVKMISKQWNNCPVSAKVMDSTESNIFDLKYTSLTNQAIKEANILGSLRHPNILLLMAVNLIVVETCPTVLYQMIFERCHRGSLHHYLHVEKEELSYTRINATLCQIGDALAFCHSQKIVHCALSSLSVFIVNSQTAKLGNFENAVELRTSDNRNKSRRSLHASTFNFINISEGTLYKWLAPEILYESGPISSAVDVYGMAVIIWEIFTTEEPHHNRTYKNVVHKFQPPFSDDITYRIPGNLLNVLQQAFSETASHRPTMNNLRLSVEASHPESGLSKEADATGDSCQRSFKYLLSSYPNVGSTGAQEGSPINSDRTVVDDSDRCQPPEDNPFKSRHVAARRHLNRKSNSLGCLSRPPRSPPPGSTPSDDRAAWYRDLAALPSHGPTDEVWRYPSPLTEVSIEGRGNLSSAAHRRTLARGMKPASHQTGLSASQTNICDLIGTADLIKTASKASLSRGPPPATNRQLPLYRKLGPRLNQTNPKIAPLGTKIADLVKKYEGTGAHPYSPSNCSSVNADGHRVFTSPSHSISRENKENSSKETFLSPSTLSLSNRLFPPLICREKQEWSSTTDEENFVPKSLRPTFLNSSRVNKPKYFSDLTNEYK